MSDENELTFEDDDDPLDRLEAVESHCSVLENVVALLAIELTRIDADARGRIVDTLELVEQSSRQRNVHDHGIQTLQRVRALIEGAPESRAALTERARAGTARRRTRPRG